MNNMDILRSMNNEELFIFLRLIQRNAYFRGLVRRKEFDGSKRNFN